MIICRILKLADHLDTVPRRGFDQAYWSRRGENLELPSRKAHEREYKCGAAACVAGHAVIVFPRLLYFSRDYDYPETPGDAASVVLRRSGDKGTTALQEVLDLCTACSYALTESSAPHQTPKRAARTLRRIAAGKSWATALGNRTSNKLTCHEDTPDCMYS